MFNGCHQLLMVFFGTLVIAVGEVFELFLSDNTVAFFSSIYCYHNSVCGILSLACES